MSLYSYRVGALALLCFSVLCLNFNSTAFAQGAASQPREYRFPSQIYSEILTDRETEIWAEVIRPQQVAPGKKWPIVIVLHGNHYTCGYCQNQNAPCGTPSNPRIDNSCAYTYTGQCPGNSVPVPNQMGYRHFTEELARNGFFTISINANRGINCGGGVSGDAGLNLARGRLILKHLELLSNWNSNSNSTPTELGIDLYDRLDFNRVGIVGHSRGGEGARAAVTQYKDQNSIWPGLIGNVNFTGVFEIGPVDGQTSRQLNPDSIFWSVILPACDGDVSNLQGIKPFDRIMRLGEQEPRFKSSLVVWGTNHNFYNSQWQSSESPGCNGPIQLFQPGLSWGSLSQQAVARETIVPFFLATNKNLPLPQHVRFFDPAYSTPAFNQLSQITRVDRGYIAGANSSISSGLDQFSFAGYPHYETNGVSVGMGYVPEHDNTLRGARVSWNNSNSANSGASFFQSNFYIQNQGPVDLKKFDYLQFRVSRANSGQNTAQSPTDFEIQLVDSAGQLSQPVRLSQFSHLIGPWNGRGSWGTHSILQTVRVPLNNFHPHFQRDACGVRFTFNQTDAGDVYFADIEASRKNPAPGQWKRKNNRSGGRGGQERLFSSSSGPDPDQGLKVGLQIENFQPVQEGGETYYDITVSTATVFPERDSLPTLWIGTEQVTQSRRPAGDMSRLIFRATAQQLQGINILQTVRMVYGVDKRFDDPWTWNFL